jgi:hypothetical protein
LHRVAGRLRLRQQSHLAQHRLPLPPRAPASPARAGSTNCAASVARSAVATKR